MIWLYSYSKCIFLSVFDTLFKILTSALLKFSEANLTCQNSLRSGDKLSCVFILRRILLLQGGHMRVAVTSTPTSDQLLKHHWWAACLEFYLSSSCTLSLRQTGWAEKHITVWIHFISCNNVAVFICFLNLIFLFSSFQDKREAKMKAGTYERPYKLSS